jgi:hypothetical protein
VYRIGFCRKERRRERDEYCGYNKGTYPFEEHNVTIVTCTDSLRQGLKYRQKTLIADEGLPE